MAEKVTDEEAKALGLQQKVSDEEAKALGLPAKSPKPPPPPSFLSQVGDYLSNLPTAARAFAQVGPAGNLERAMEDPEFGANEARARVRSALSGATFGFAPKLVEAAGEAEPGAMQAEYSRDVASHPAENVAGSIAAPMPGGAVKGAGGVALRMGLNALAAGANEANTNPNATPLSVGGHALAGGALSGAGEAAAPMLEKAAGKLFVKAVGPRAGIVDRLAKQGIRPEEVSNLGQEFNKMGLVPFLGGKEAIANRSAQKAREIFAERAPLISEFNRAAPYDFEATSRAAQPFNLSQTAQAAAGPAKRFASGLANETGGLEKMTQNLSDAYRSVNWAPKPPLAAGIFKGSVGQARQDMLRQVSQALGAPKAEQLADWGRRYGIAATARDLSGGSATREALHQTFNPTEMMVAGIAGGPEAAVVEPLAKAALNRANAPVAHTLNALSSVAPEAGLAARQSPQTFTDWLQQQREDAKERLKSDE